jgi:hypothetical protein
MGARNGNAKLTAAQVIEIRRAMAALVVAEIGKPKCGTVGPVQRALAERYGVKVHTIIEIASGRRTQLAHALDVAFGDSEGGF